MSAAGSDAPLLFRGRGGPLVASAVGMMSGKAAAMFLGFAFWLIAARIAPASHVGIAAAGTAAIMLVTLLSSSGLGAASVVHYHRKLGQTAAKANTDLAVFIGPDSQHAFNAFLESRDLLHGAAIECFDDKTPRIVAKLIEPGDTVLIKASRSMQLERLIPTIKAKLKAQADDMGSTKD